MGRILDLVGASLSTLCLLHCLALPILVSALPALVRLHAQDSSFHLCFALLVVPVGLFALWPGYREHRVGWVLWLGSAGLICISLAALAHEHLGDDLEHAVTIVGGVQLLVAHLVNRRLRGKMSCCVGGLSPQDIPGNP